MEIFEAVFWVFAYGIVTVLGVISLALLTFIFALFGGAVVGENKPFAIRAAVGWGGALALGSILSALQSSGL